MRKRRPRGSGCNGQCRVGVVQADAQGGWHCKREGGDAVAENTSGASWAFLTVGLGIFSRSASARSCYVRRVLLGRVAVEGVDLSPVAPKSGPSRLCSASRKDALRCRSSKGHLEDVLEGEATARALT
jgi:hypothetical protein